MLLPVEDKTLSDCSQKASYICSRDGEQLCVIIFMNVKFIQNVNV